MGKSRRRIVISDLRAHNTHGHRQYSYIPSTRGELRTDGENDSICRDVARPCVVWPLERFEPFFDFFWFAICEEEPDGAFQVLHTITNVVNGQVGWKGGESAYVRLRLLISRSCIPYPLLSPRQSP